MEGGISPGSNSDGDPTTIVIGMLTGEMEGSSSDTEKAGKLQDEEVKRREEE